MDTEGPHPPGPLAYWSTTRIALAAVVLIAATALVTILVAGRTDRGPSPAGPAPASAEALTGPLDRLSQTSASVTAFVAFGSMRDDDERSTPPVTLVPDDITDPSTPETTTTTAPAEPGDRIELESGVVDFATASAVMGTSGRPVPPAVVVDGVAYLDWDRARTARPGATDPSTQRGWVQMPPEVGMHAFASTVPFLLSLVDHAGSWVDPSSVTADGDLVEARIDDARVRADVESTLAGLDTAAAELARAELADGTRALPSGRLQVRTGADGLPVEIRVEVVTTGQVGTLTWKLSDHGVTVSASVPPADERIAYEDFTADLRALTGATGTSEPVDVSNAPPPGPTATVDQSQVVIDPAAPERIDDLPPPPPSP